MASSLPRADCMRAFISTRSARTNLRPRPFSVEVTDNAAVQSGSGGVTPVALYRLVTGALSPAAPLLLRLRPARGKADQARLPERTGHASLPRPGGTLGWIHGASGG